MYYFIPVLPTPSFSILASAWKVRKKTALATLKVRGTIWWDYRSETWDHSPDVAGKAHPVSGVFWIHSCTNSPIQEFSLWLPQRFMSSQNQQRNYPYPVILLSSGKYILPPPRSPPHAVQQSPAGPDFVAAAARGLHVVHSSCLTKKNSNAVGCATRVGATEKVFDNTGSWPTIIF